MIYKQFTIVFVDISLFFPVRQIFPISFFNSEQESRRKVKQLQKKLVEVKKEKEIEVQKRREMIAHLKDQVQEMKAKTNMEGKYIKKVTDVSIAQMQKKCSLIENKTQLEIQVWGSYATNSFVCTIIYFISFY